MTRIAITGATGNAGTAVLAALRDETSVDEIVAIARRPATFSDPRVRFVRADVATDDLAAAFAGADVVIHLAWLIQPSRDARTLHAVNVEGSRRVFEAVAQAGVGTVVHASSVGAYSPGPKDTPVDESWPTNGIDSLFYARHKVAAERLLDDFEREHPEVRAVRLRPGLIFSRAAATGIRRLFAGPFLPRALLQPGLAKLVPDIPRLRVQAVHALDVGEAYRLAALGDARGAFNIAAGPVIDPDTLSRLAGGARRVKLPAGLVRAAAAASYAARLQPTPPGWLDMGLAVPIMDIGRAHRELGWTPVHSATEALLELLAGMRDGAGHPTPPLDPATSGRFRRHELEGLVGARDADPRLQDRREG